jgi:C4-dicarboxylate-specific signal transduction histidine kinase
MAYRYCAASIEDLREPPVREVLPSQPAYTRDSERQESGSLMELTHADRIAIIGRLAASIPHEVNQPITAMVTNAQAALRLLDRQALNLEEVRRALTSVVQDGHRACDVINCMRALIKKTPLQRDRLDINEAIRGAIELTHGEAVRNGVSVKSELAGGLPLVQGDRVHLQQVILNLIINAVEAMSSVSEGPRELLISSSKARLGVLVMVRDSGPAVAPGALERAFDAFYTTKARGLGLGLSICRAIIEAHGGQLWASRNEIRGATFQFIVGDGRPIDRQSAATASKIRATGAESPA